MLLAPNQSVSLTDCMNRSLGQVLIDRVQGDLVFGQFSPGPDFAIVEKVFADYIEAANDQVLGIVAELDAVIATLGLRLQCPEAANVPAIYDVHIGSGTINFRVRAHGHNGPARQRGSTHAAKQEG